MNWYLLILYVVALVALVVAIRYLALIAQVARSVWMVQRARKPADIPTYVGGVEFVKRDAK
jgi:hypothetical protein